MSQLPAGAFRRYDESPDEEFYNVPRLVMVAAASVLAQIGPEFADQELESGNISTETSLSIDGNNNQCAGLLQFNQSGNFVNQQGTGQYDNLDSELEVEPPEYEFAPESETACNQEVEQASSASSGWGSL